MTQKVWRNHWAGWWVWSMLGRAASTNVGKQLWGEWWVGCMYACFRCPKCPGVECSWHLSTPWPMVEALHLLTRTPAVLSHTTVGRLATCSAVALLIYTSAQTAIMAQARLHHPHLQSMPEVCDYHVHLCGRWSVVKWEFQWTWRGSICSHSNTVLPSCRVSPTRWWLEHYVQVHSVLVGNWR